MQIWENMRYPANPGPIYTQDEARSLRLVRKWTQQFYRGTSRATITPTGRRRCHRSARSDGYRAARGYRPKEDCRA